MSLIKLAMQPIIVVNNTDPNQSSSKTFSKKNIAAAAIGGTTGWSAGHLAETKIIKNFDKLKPLHSYGSNMAKTIGGFTGAATAFHLMNKKNNDKEPQFFMV